MGLILIIKLKKIISSKKELLKVISDELKEIKTITSNEAAKLFKENKCNLIDIRDIRELERDGRVKNSLHIPRGMLEFWMDPSSPYYKQGKIDPSKETILFCAAGLRSALATKTLQDMGFKNVSHVDGGFSTIKSSDFEII